MAVSGPTRPSLFLRVNCAVMALCVSYAILYFLKLDKLVRLYYQGIWRWFLGGISVPIFMYCLSGAAGYAWQVGRVGRRTAKALVLVSALFCVTYLVLLVLNSFFGLNVYLYPYLRIMGAEGMPVVPMVVGFLFGRAFRELDKGESERGEG